MDMPIKKEVHGETKETRGKLTHCTHPYAGRGPGGHDSQAGTRVLDLVCARTGAGLPTREIRPSRMGTASGSINGVCVGLSGIGLPLLKGDKGSLNLAGDIIAVVVPQYSSPFPVVTSP